MREKGVDTHTQARENRKEGGEEDESRREKHFMDGNHHT
jgi:hypothetical protein